MDTINAISIEPSCHGLLRSVVCRYVVAEAQAGTRQRAGQTLPRHVAERARIVDDGHGRGWRLLVADDPAEQGHDHDRRDEDQRKGPMVAPEELRDASGDRKSASRVHAAVSLAGVLSAQLEECLLDVVGAHLLADLRGRPAREQLAVEHQQQLVAAIRLVHDVAADEKCLAVRGKPAEVFPELDAQLRVDAHGRLVQEDHLRLVDERAGQRKTPAHTARQLERRCIATLVQLHDLQGFLERLLVRRARQGAEEAHVLPDRQLGVDAVGLGHVADWARFSRSGIRVPSTRASPGSAWRGR